MKVSKMDRAKKLSEKTRITLDLSPEFYDRLEKLEARVGAESKAQVLREALRLYEYIAYRYLEGDEFFTRSKEGDEKAIVILGVSPVTS